MRPQAIALPLGRKTELRPEKEQDVRSLPDDETPGPEDRLHETRMLERCFLYEALHRLGALLPRDIDVLGLRLLQRQADEFAAPGIGGRVIEFVSHGSSFQRNAPRAAMACSVRW